MQSSLEKALVQWASKYAESYKQHGIPEGQSPSDWCNEVLVDAALEDPGVLKVLADAAKQAFLAACQPVPPMTREQAAEIDRGHGCYVSHRADGVSRVYGEVSQHCYAEFQNQAAIRRGAAELRAELMGCDTDTLRATCREDLCRAEFEFKKHECWTDDYKGERALMVKCPCCNGIQCIEVTVLPNRIGLNS